jgi:multiple sugar transport system permease protein
MAKRSFNSTLLPTVLTYLGLAVGLVFAGFPILWMFFTSLKSNTEIFALPPRLLPEHFTNVAYLSIFNDPVKVRFFINSYLVAGVVTLLTLLIAILTAGTRSRARIHSTCSSLARRRCHPSRF